MIKTIKHIRLFGTRFFFLMLVLIIASSIELMSLAFASAKSPVTPPHKALGAVLTKSSAIVPTPSITASTLLVGLPLLRSFNPKEYGADPQNWAIIQDLRGVIYIGNGDGVLEFDGVRWRLIRIASNTVVRSLAVDDQGRVYVGSVGEIGYLHPDASGQMAYVSLLDRLPLDAQNFSDVWNTFVTPKGVIFLSSQSMFRLQGKKVEYWTPTTAFHNAFHVRERIFVREWGRGLLELSDGQLQLLTGGELFADERIYAMLPNNSTTKPASDSILVGTRTQGFFKFDVNGFTTWPTDIDSEIRRDLLYCATQLPDGRLALGTTKGGLYILDDQGEKVGRLNKAIGLPNDTVLSLSVDREGGLWIGTDNGLARAEVDSPLSHFDERSGLTGTIYAVHRHLGQLYVGTAQGLFRLQTMPTPYFEHIAGINSQTWTLLSVDKQLLVGNAQGVHLVFDDNATLIKRFEHVLSLLASKTKPGRIFVGTSNSLAALRWVDGRLIDEGVVPGIEVEVRTLFEDDEGALWLGTKNSGVIKVIFSLEDNDTLELLKIERFGVDEGLPSLKENGVYSLDNVPRFATEDGVYLFNDVELRFEPDLNFDGLFAQSRGVQQLTEAEQGTWLLAYDPTDAFRSTGLAARQADGSYRWDDKPLSALAGMAIVVIYHDLDSVSWFGSSEGLFRLDSGITKDYSQPFTALVRRVSGRKDRSVFAGTGKASALRLDYSDNALRFEFAATSFDGQGSLLFQTSIDDNEWSKWSAETYKDYNNLFEGDYRFRVRSKNLYGIISEQDEYAFTLLPPWYRSVWAYLTYVIVLSLIGWAVIRCRLQRLKIQQIVLEKSVIARTAELEDSNNTIKVLSDISSEISANLELDKLLDSVYRQIKTLMIVDVFFIGIYEAEHQHIRFKYPIEDDEMLPDFVISLNETNRPAVWCVEHQQPVIMNDFAKDYSRFFTNKPTPISVVDNQPQSLMYWPLLIGSRVIGVLTVQSLQKNSYNTDQQEMIKTLASTIAVALDNANAYFEIEQKKVEVELQKQEVEEQKQAIGEKNKEILATQKQLVQSSKMASIGTMTAGVAHEINNPTNFAHAAAHMMQDEIIKIKTFLKQLAGGDKAEPEVLQSFDEQFTKLIELAKTTSEGTTRIKNIVEDLRTFARVDDAKQAQVQMSDLINSTVHLVRSQYDSIIIETQLAYEPFFTCFPSKLNQVFMNIIVNACQAIEGKKVSDSKVEGKVLIKAVQHGKQLIITFEDNGCGMTERTLSRIFEPFYTTKDVGSGTGLGMAISFGIIEEHEGQINVVSEVDKGTKVTISFNI